MNKPRTNQQNNALHLYFEMVAETLNDAGLEIKEVMAIKEVDVPWTKNSVKEILWRPIQESMVGEKSTTKLAKIEVNDVYDVLNRALGQKLGVHVPFPSEEN